MKKPNTTQNQRRKPSQARSRQSVDTIVEASAQVLEQCGYRAATTNRIAERAGVSVGTLYQYFNNKDEIFDALIEREAARYLDALERSMPGLEVPPRQAVRGLLEAAYAHHRLVLGVRAVMRHLPSAAYNERSKGIREEMHRLVMQFLALRGSLASHLSRPPVRGGGHNPHTLLRPSQKRQGRGSHVPRNTPTGRQVRCRDLLP